MNIYTIIHMTLWSNSTFLTLERDWKESSWGKAAKSSTNINPNVVDYEGLTELSPLGLPQLYVGLSATSCNL
jgi:hypothetical protein